MAGDGYKYDFFISYRRSGNVADWVTSHLHPVLLNNLTDLLRREPSVFIDTGQELGVDYPENLANALLRSRYLIAVWSPPYFESRWCVAEWRTMRKREDELGMRSRANPQGLVFPIVFSDGDYFPRMAQRTQGRMDFSRWGYPYPQFRETPEYLLFHDAVKDLAQELAPRLEAAPPWSSAWPVVTPQVRRRRSPEIPRL